MLLLKSCFISTKIFRVIFARLLHLCMSKNDLIFEVIKCFSFLELHKWRSLANMTLKIFVLIKQLFSNNILNRKKKIEIGLEIINFFLDPYILGF